MPTYQLNLDVSKEDMLTLNDLAGEGVSIREYMSKIIHEHVAAHRRAQADETTCLCKDDAFINDETPGRCGNCGKPFRA